MNYIGWVIVIGLGLGFAALAANFIAKRIMPYPSNRGEYGAIVVFIFVIIIVGQKPRNLGQVHEY